MFFKTMNDNMSKMVYTKIKLLALKTVLRFNYFKYFISAKLLGSLATH